LRLTRKRRKASREAGNLGEPGDKATIFDLPFQLLRKKTFWSDLLRFAENYSEMVRIGQKPFLMRTRDCPQKLMKRTKEWGRSRPGQTFRWQDSEGDSDLRAILIMVKKNIGAKWCKMVRFTAKWCEQSKPMCTCKPANWTGDDISGRQSGRDYWEIFNMSKLRERS
jgi:hypothetical protein